MRVELSSLLPSVFIGVVGLTLSACGGGYGSPLVSISPENPGTEDVLRLQVAGRDGISYRVSWTVDGAAVEEDVRFEIPAELTNRGQEWEATVTPVDEDGNTYKETVIAVRVGNAAPSGIVSLNPSAPTTGVDLVAQPGFIDPDGDDVTATFSWTRNGTDAGIDGPVVPGDQLVKGDEWEVTVAATDGDLDAALATAKAVVANTAPQAEGAVISPDVAFDDTTLTCTGLRFADADGDAEQYKIIWKVDGSIVSSEAELTGEFFDRGQSVTCELVPTDGESDGNRVYSSPVVIQNGVPTIGSVVINETVINRNAPVTYTIVDLFDADGDEVALDIWWLVNGRGVTKDESLDPMFFQRGDEIRLEVTPSDDFSTGETAFSAAVNVTNAPPVVVSSEWMVDPLYTDSLIEPETVVVDNDGDEFTVAYEWSVNGVVVGDDAGSLDGSDGTFARGDKVSYKVTGDDGEGAGPVFSSSVEDVVNKPPDIPELVIDPELILPTENIFCTTDGEITDADGDTVTVQAFWTLDGVAYTGLADETDYKDDTIPSTATSLTERWGCTLEADDGTDVAVSEEVIAQVRPEKIEYQIESKAGLTNVGSSCSSGGKTGYYGNHYYSSQGVQFNFDDDYNTTPDKVTLSWRHGYWYNYSSYGYLYINGSSLYANLGIARSTSCDSGRTYSLTITGVSSLWRTGKSNRFGVVHGCCSYYNNGVFYDDTLKYGTLRVYTDLDPS